ncbi:hypothetical protein [Actinorugispora endophytica]|uniref:Uncharacterized protein n=1 Tax=Actinorugispora endophytica TaxID=1605990 RepID=A0A4R6V0K8_9ACTN|nr:hypothetical protein [Actinorugispora endophytica]TDQ53440.1 hypothetical protein EV190_104230 [Actinorugispora endophytica]
MTFKSILLSGAAAALLGGLLGVGFTGSALADEAPAPVPAEADPTAGPDGTGADPTAGPDGTPLTVGPDGAPLDLPTPAPAAPIESDPSYTG